MHCVGGASCANSASSVCSFVEALHGINGVVLVKKERHDYVTYIFIHLHTQILEPASLTEEPDYFFLHGDKNQNLTGPLMLVAWAVHRPWRWTRYSAPLRARGGLPCGCSSRGSRAAVQPQADLRATLAAHAPPCAVARRGNLEENGGASRGAAWTWEPPPPTRSGFCKT